MPRKKKIEITGTDMFCGAGGSSQGASWNKDVRIRMAMNHWQLAIESHNTNFPDADHDCADIHAVDPRRYPTTTFLWASPSCTNHTVAKGKKRRKRQMHLFNEFKPDPEAERSRATMFDVPRFAEYHDYEFIIVENVVEVRWWIFFEEWLSMMHKLGYDHEIVYFNSMFAHLDPFTDGYNVFVPQSRDRFYAVFWKRGNKRPNLQLRPKAPCATCGKDVEAVQSWKRASLAKFGKWGRYGKSGQYIYCCPECANEVFPYHFAAANIIDWSFPSVKIGERKENGMRPLKKKTLDRIQRGLDKFAGDPAIIPIQYWHSKHDSSKSAFKPLPTQMGTQAHALITPFVVRTSYFSDRPRKVDEPMPTQTGAARHCIVIPDGKPFLARADWFGKQHIGLDEPAATQTGDAKYALLTQPAFLAMQYSPGYERGVDGATGAVTTSDHHALITGGQFVVKFRGNEYGEPIDNPLSTVTGIIDKGLIGTPFMLGYANGDGPAKSALESARTVHTNNGQGLVQPADIKVEDCYFRMLQPHEIGGAMGFHEEYVVLGTKREKVKQYGNAVTPEVARLLIDRCVQTLM